jgi:hypothetical protein
VVRSCCSDDVSIVGEPSAARTPPLQCTPEVLSKERPEIIYFSSVVSLEKGGGGIGNSVFIGSVRSVVNFLRIVCAGLAPAGRLPAGFKVAPASPTSSPATSLPTIDEMDRDTEQRQADNPIPKEPRSANQGSAGNENDPLDHAEDGRLSPR